jgi:tRNA (guanine-N7-)-methyltransferase
MKIVGALVERARAGHEIPSRHYNPYLMRATEFDGLLLTPAEIQARGAQSIFDCPSECPSESLNGSGNVFRPLVVEVGSYMGKNLIEMATQFPAMDFLGLDITYKRTVKTAQKIRLAGLGNAKVAICDARPFFKELQSQTLTGICVFFPDPWPKLRQSKNRLWQSEFFEQASRSLVPGGFLWIKTDSKSYFEQAIEQSSEWFVPSTAPQQGTLVSHAVPELFAGQDFVTVFEELFRRKGQPVWSTVLIRKNEKVS